MSENPYIKQINVNFTSTIINNLQSVTFFHNYLSIIIIIFFFFGF